MNNEFLRTEAIEEYLKDKKMSKAEFCKRCNMSVPTLNKVINGRLNVRISVIFNIAIIIVPAGYKFFLS